MPIGHALLTSSFLILAEFRSGSWVNRGLSIVRSRLWKEKPLKAAEIESGQEEPKGGQLELSKPSAVRLMPKARPLTALRRNRRNEAQAGCGPESQKVIHFQ